MRTSFCIACLVLAASLNLPAQCVAPDARWEAALLPKVQIHTIKFVGATQLPWSIQKQFARDLRRQEFAGPDWEDNVKETVREAWMEHGYFKASVETEAQILSSDGKRQEVSVTVRVKEGRQYRFKKLGWSHGEPFRAKDLDKLFPLRPGEIFDVSKVREGLEALRKFYASQGYLDFTSVPNTEVDERETTIVLRIDLDPGDVFRLGTFDVLGADAALKNRLLADWELKAGDPFNAEYVERFFQQHRPLFPNDPENALCRKLKWKQHVVDLVLDLADCECSP